MPKARYTPSSRIPRFSRTATASASVTTCLRTCATTSPSATRSLSQPIRRCRPIAAPAASRGRGSPREVQAQTGSGDDPGAGRRRPLARADRKWSIRAEKCAAPFYAQTGSGDIDAELTGSGDVDVQTGSAESSCAASRADFAPAAAAAISPLTVSVAWSLELAHRLRIHSPGGRLWQRLQSGCAHQLWLDSL